MSISDLTLLPLNAADLSTERAYRERQEGRIKELQVKVMELEIESTSIKEENERLKKELAQSGAKHSTGDMSRSLDDMDVFGNPFDRGDHQ